MDRNKIRKKIIFWNFFVWLFLIIALYQSYAVYFVDLTSTKSKWVGLFAGAVAVLFASVRILENLFYGDKNDSIQKIGNYFYNGALVFFRSQIKFLFIFAVLIFWFLFKKIGVSFLICFIFGIITFLFSYFISVFMCSKTIIRVVKAIEESGTLASKMALNSGVVSSFMGVGVSLCVVTILFHLYKDYQTINGFLLGASFACLFGCVCSAIIKKSASCALGVVSGHVADIDLYDKRSPVLLLNGLSKIIFNVGSVSSDMLLTFCAILIASMTIGAFAYNLMGCFLPIVICAGGVFASVLSILLMKINKVQNYFKIFYFSIIKAVVILAIISFYCIKIWIPDGIGLFYSILVGLFSSVLVCFVGFKYLNGYSKAVKKVANVAISGFVPAFLQTLQESFMSLFLPAVLISLNIILSFLLAEGIESPLFGIYGIALSILSMISTMGVVLCINNFSVILNSSGEVIESYENNDVKVKAQELYFGGATYSSVIFGKNFFDISAILSSILVFIAYTFVAELEMIDVLNPYVLGSLFIGVSLPFLYIAFILSGVNNISKRLVFESKKQFRNYPQILRFEMRPDYEKCIDIASLNSIIQVVFYTMLIVIIFVFIALYLKSEAVGGLVIGAILSSSCLLFFAGSSSFIARSAKKFLRKEYENSNLSDEYAVLIQNDEVFNSIKELFIPTIKSLIKFLAILLLTLAPLFM